MTMTFERLETQPEFRVADLAQMTTEQAAMALVRRAAELRASDLFVLSDARYVTIAVKRLGSVDRLAVLSTEFGRQLMSYVKAYAELDISEKRRPADSRWIVQLPDRRLDLRINFTPTLHGEDLAIRISDHALGMYELAELGLSQTDFTGLRSLLQSSHGLLVVTGPTGAGKTTTLYACLRYLNDGSRKINTLEDPVEYSLDGIRQSQTNLKLGLDFAELLRNVLRQAPDVIMIGEIRDPETMSTAIRAANSGLLVLATLHAPTAAGSIQSMLALDANPFFLSNCLLGVVSQRLVRTLCRECRTPADPLASAAALTEVAELRGTEGPPLAFEPVGCDSCYHRGYAGRSGLFEWMRITPEIRRLIAAAKSTREIEAAAIRAGMVEFRRSGLLKVAEGTTSADEILREIPADTSWEYKGLELGK